MRRLRGIRSGAATLVAGALLGFVGAGIASLMIPQSATLEGSTEPAVPRRFMIALIEDDIPTLHRLSPPSSVASRAADYKRKLISPASGAVTETLTYLGGRIDGPLQVHSYAVGLRSAEGEQQLVFFALSVVDNLVVRLE